jgi:hypothetical protein
MKLSTAPLLVLLAAPLAAQSRPDTVAVRVSAHSSKVDTLYTNRSPARDATDMLSAARTHVGKRDSTVARDVIELRANTAWVTVWTREGRFGRGGQQVRVERRAGEWVAVRSSVSNIVSVRY